jgi:DNA polymerase III epsilon subunit-like protein
MCTYELSKAIYGNGKGVNTLDTVCNRYGISLDARAECHGAMVDTLLMADMYPILMIDHYKEFK